MLFSTGTCGGDYTQPSDWAIDEVTMAIKSGLVPKELRGRFANGISRENLSKMLVCLLSSVCEKETVAGEASFTDTTDSDVLYAANLDIIKGYEQNDGTYMFKPHNTLKRAEMAVILNRVAKLCGEEVNGYNDDVTFDDTVSHWCNKELGWPVHFEIVKGTTTTTFSPESTLTVEQAITMIYRAYKILK